MRISRKAAVLIPITLALVLGACGSADTDGGSQPADDSAAVGTTGNESTDEDAAKPALSQPDVNGDGEVVIGIMSPGDTKDNGYYQAFVDDANAFAEENGWKVITLDRVNPADAVEQALNLCSQGVDLISIGAGELKDSLDAAPNPECANVNWYVNAGASGVEQTEYFAQSQELVVQNQFTVGYAAGLAMKEKGIDTAGYVSGPEADFSIQAAKAFTAGMREVMPDAKLIQTYTGDFDDSAKAKEAALAQIDHGVEILYPYLGGATDSAATVANERGVLTISPGTDRCDDQDVIFNISAVFSPGAYFAAALDAFKNNKLEMGQSRTWRVGVDSAPTTKLCGDLASLQPQWDELAASVAAGDIDVDAKVDAVTD